MSYLFFHLLAFVLKTVEEYNVCVQLKNRNNSEKLQLTVNFHLTKLNLCLVDLYI